jgi:predicted amidophosphoribosyltransferase
MLRIVKYFLKKKGILCMMCEDALATEPKQVCKECAKELLDIEMHYYHRDEMELLR